MQTKDPLPTRKSLLAGIKDANNHVAWQEFFERYGGLIRRLALKAGLTETEADEVAQEVFISVTRNIGEFAYDPAKCSFKHWLSQMVRWRIRDQFARRLPTEAGFAGPRNAEDDGEPLDAIDSVRTEPELEALWEAEWRQHLVDRTAARVKDLVNAKQFQIYFLHVLKGMDVSEVVHRLKVTRAQVYLAKLRVGRLFRKELKMALG